MEFKIDGMDDFQRNIEELKRRAQELTTPRSVSLNEFLPPEFMKAHTKFDSIDAMFKASGTTMDPRDLFNEDKIADDWNAFVAANSNFKDWVDMLSHGNAERVKKGLGFSG